MSIFKKCQVVMLPTNEKAGHISIGNQSKNAEFHIFQYEKGGIYNNHTFQHLYILSDETPKDEDLVLPNDLSNPFNRKPYKFSSVSAPLPYWCNADSCKKIIATTDKSLTSFPIGQPMRMINKPSQSFIEKYVEQYNKGIVISEIMVQYEGGCENYRICK